MKWLQDIKVVDLSTVLAGPSVASFLGELGAQVHKFESPYSGGDVTRSWRIPGEQTQEPVSAYFASINYCKTYHTLDLRDSEAQKQLHQQLIDTDVLISNYKEEDYEKFGLTAELIREKFPKLIHARLRGFDSDPSRVAYDVVLQAECGMMALNGSADGPPTKFPIAIVDVLAAHQMKEAILLALYQRERTGKGCVLRASLEKSGLSGLVNQASNYLMTGQLPQRLGSKHPNIAPYGDMFKSADDQWIVLAIGSDRQFQDLCVVLKLETLHSDPQFVTNPQRVLNREVLNDRLSQAFSSIHADDFMKSSREKNIPAGIVRNMDQVISVAQQLDMIHNENIEHIPTSRIKTVAFEQLA
jgi:crotonobetainyl-CoA:carnitine CoA-transferase CaiB-like acyl-CoA transferase